MCRIMPEPRFFTALSSCCLFGCLLGFGTVHAESGVGLIDGEFRINTYTQNNQSFPEVAMAPDGTVVVVWESLGGQDGDKDAVAVQRYASNGSPLGSEFLANTTTADHQSKPSVAVAADGSFIVLWRSEGQDGDGWGIYAQRYDAGASPLGAEFRVSVESERDQALVFGDFDTAGNFMAAWESDEQDGSSGGIYGRVYDSAFQAGDEFQVNTTTQSWQHDVDVEGLESGFLVTWESLNVDSSDRAVVLRRYSSSGTPLTGEQQVNITEAGHQHNPVVAARSDGTFVVAWESVGQDGSEAAAMARLYASDGTPTSGEIQLNQTTGGDQENLSITADGRGGFVVVWDGDAASGGDFDEIWGRRLLANGVLDGDEFRINSNTSNRQTYPVIAADADGRLMAVWFSWTGDGSGTSVAGQRLWVTGLHRDGFESGDTDGWTSSAP